MWVVQRLRPPTRLAAFLALTATVGSLSVGGPSAELGEAEAEAEAATEAEAEAEAEAAKDGSDEYGESDRQFLLRAVSATLKAEWTQPEASVLAFTEHALRCCETCGDSVFNRCMRAEGAHYCLPCVAHGRLPAHLVDHSQLMEQAPHQELCRLYNLAARLLLLPDGSDPTGVAAHDISLGGAVGGRSSGSGDTSPSMAMLALRRLSRKTEEDGEEEEEACLLAPLAAAARSKPAAPVAVAEKAVAAKRRQTEAAADEEGVAKQARPPSPLAFTSSGRVRTAPQRLDASLLAASLYGKNGSAGKNKKEAAAVAAAEEKAKEEEEAEEDGTALGQGKSEEEDSGGEEEACSTCGGVHTSKSNAMLLCDGPGCEQAFHQQCLVPPLQCVPEGDWLCSTCSSVKPAAETKGTERPKPGAEMKPAAKATAPQGDGLPDGWVCTTHGRPGGEQYKRYKGPNGLRSQSIRQAWVIHARASAQGSLPLRIPESMRISVGELLSCFDWAQTGSFGAGAC